MMRALAVLSAAAVVLFALPTTAGAASDSATAENALQNSGTGIATFLSERSLFGMSLGAVLWLSVAVLAVASAFFFLGRSRGHLETSDTTSATDQVTRIGRPDFSVDSAKVAR